uniref:Uncharacterized protein n=1 Tax=Romanomermis culicivorax TaxID=13658 RepID=A0A915HTG4_ROMCU
MCYPNSPYAVADAQLAQQIETSLNLAPPERHYGCQHNSTICE